MKTLITNKNIYIVTVNDNGTLSIVKEYTTNGHTSPWKKVGTPIQNAGSFILSQGGVSAVLTRCVDVKNLAQWVELDNASRETQRAIGQARATAIAAEHKKEYNEIFGSGETVKATLHNIRVLLRHLNEVNWGVWSLPKMEISYACNQYDCNGQTATAIILNEPIEGATHFVYGAPHGYLTKYRRL